MSVDRNDYIILGYELSGTFAREQNIDFDTPKFSHYYHGHPDTIYRIVGDEMSGEYVAFGFLIQQADKWEGFTFQVIEPRMWSSAIAEGVKQKFIELFGFLPPGEPHVLVFTHWH
jgi:hypothetical protein